MDNKEILKKAYVNFKNHHHLKSVANIIIIGLLLILVNKK